MFSYLQSCRTEPLAANAESTSGFIFRFNLDRIGFCPFFHGNIHLISSLNQLVNIDNVTVVTSQCDRNSYSGCLLFEIDYFDTENLRKRDPFAWTAVVSCSCVQFSYEHTNLRSSDGLFHTGSILVLLKSGPKQPGLSSLQASLAPGKKATRGRPIGPLQFKTTL